MTIATIILAILGVAVCIWGVCKERPTIQSCGVFLCMIAFVLAVIVEMT